MTWMTGPPDTPVRLLQVTDPHLFGDEARTICGVTTAVSLRKVLAAAFASGSARPGAVLVTGNTCVWCSAATCTRRSNGGTDARSCSRRLRRAHNSRHSWNIA
jgi:hypothetical protein